MKGGSEDTLLSITVPIYNEEKTLPKLHERLTEVLDDLSLSAEIILVNDGSQDGSLEVMKELRQKDSRIKIVSFSRNFGHQNAVTAGVDHSQGDAVVIMDGDLQDPPEVIPRLLEKWEEGYDVAYAKRKERKGESFFKKFTAKAFYRFFDKMTDIDIPLDTGDFRLMDSAVADQLKSMREKHRFIRGMVSWVGFKQIAVEYEREERYAGETKYPLSKMINFALDGITSFSSVPLRLATWFGFFVSGLAFFYLLAVFGLWIAGISWPGYTSIIGSILLLGGVQLITIGVMGEYVGRIYDETKGRPVYISEEKYGFSDSKQDEGKSGSEPIVEESR